MTTDNKTLADVQPGGRVRLGDQAERARFEEWYVQNAFDYEANPIGSRDCALMRKAWNAALSAQPSPGGQGSTFPWENFPAYLIDKCEGDTISEEGLQQALAAMAKDERYCLAARQPVGEPEPYVVGNQYFTQAGDLVRFVAVHNEGTSYECMEDEAGVNRYTRRDFGRVTGSAHDYSDPRNTPPLYAAPPAQAVDLGQLPRVIELLSNVSRTLVDWAADEQREAIGIVKALIDSQAVQS